MKKLVIYGAGSFGEIFYHEACMFSDFEIVAFTVDRKYIREDIFCGLPVIPLEEVTLSYPPTDYKMIVVAGYSDMRARKMMFTKAKDLGYTLINYISSHAIVEPGVKMGENNIIFSDAFVGHDVVLGDNNMLRQKVYLGHNSVMGSHNIIATGGILGGKSTISDLSFFGLGMVGRDSIHYGNEILVAFGSVVTKDVDSYATVIGSPAKTINYHKETGVIVKN